ncbi:MAG: Rpn family recombination-promoting nuclease/putative transposase [Clostridiales bacterium]|nr:Rpn family recombination-promoting nuclease/putative transposase [Clostridiales bacterium]
MMKRKYLSVKNDFVFKKLFGEPGNEEILKSFLEAVLGIKILKVAPRRDTILLKDIQSEKTGILDVRATLDSNKEINIEMQVNPDNNMFKRTFFYTSKLYTEGFEAGKMYNELKKVISINILSHDFLKSNRCHTIYKLANQDNNSEDYNEVVEIHFIETRKLILDHEVQTDLRDWIRFIDSEEDEVINVLSDENKDIKVAKEKLEWLSRDEETRIIAENRAKYLSDLNSSIACAKAEGKAEGKAEIVKRMINNGITAEDIVSMTGIDKKEIDQIISEYK